MSKPRPGKRPSEWVGAGERYDTLSFTRGAIAPVVPIIRAQRANPAHRVLQGLYRDRKAARRELDMNRNLARNNKGPERYPWQTGQAPEEMWQERVAEYDKAIRYYERMRKAGLLESLVEHDGPGPHESGSPQAVHGGGPGGPLLTGGQHHAGANREVIVNSPEAPLDVAISACAVAAMSCAARGWERMYYVKETGGGMAKIVSYIDGQRATVGSHESYAQHEGEHVIHGHPDNGPLSPGDLHAMAKHSFASITAITADGATTYTFRPAKGRTPQELSARLGMGKAIEPNMQMVDKALTLHYNPLYETARLSATQAQHQFTHSRWVWATTSPNSPWTGWLEYEAKGAGANMPVYNPDA